ncbi:MAG: sialidase family protein [bacterium]|nr:sialidase family protein [bacterium]
MVNKISVTRELEQRVEGQTGWVHAQSYASLKDNSLVRGVERKDAAVMLRSEDNGKTWKDTQVVIPKEKLPNKRIREGDISAFYLDSDNGILVRFVHDRIVSDQSCYEEYVEDFANAGSEKGPKTSRLFYDISRDGGKTWEKRQQLIEKGDEYNSEHWAKDVLYGKSSLVLEGRRLHKLADGTIVAPCYLWPTDEQMKKIFQKENRPQEIWYFKGYVYTVCLLGRWRKDLSGIDWKSGGHMLLPGGYTSAGVCGSDEPTIAYLDDGRMFCVVRTSASPRHNFRETNIPVLPYCGVSKDKGITWQDIRPLTYSDDSSLYSPSAYSEFIKSSKNGKWYWIANILPEPTYGQCDPRDILQIAELDTKTLGIKKETMAIVENRAPGDPELVRFSNFRVYEERETKDFILLMTKSYSELEKDYFKLPRPSYCYRIHF